MVATRLIKQGELVLKEKPLFVVPHHVTSSPSALISQLLREASPQDRETFLNLSYVKLPKNLKPEDHPDEVALAIFQTNAVAAGGDVGIFPRMTRLNHGCSSAFNVVYNWREREGALVVHALRPIQKGEELLTTYTNTKRPRNERRQVSNEALLAEHYGFHCTCSVCSLPEAQSAISDKRLLEISDSYDQFATWGGQIISGSEAIELVKKIWDLGSEEGYWSERGRLAADAAWVAASYSDAAGVREWAELAIEWYTYELGGDSEQVQEMKLVVKDPESHAGWGVRSGY
ncbi:hypothetical protein L208DRAFT_1431725 [Tricholoma matsutake]|nr:hypothetical protein L208DRAFT_1431725 [Tricholoma matsutake 945]